MWMITTDLINKHCHDRLDLRRSHDWNADTVKEAYAFQLRDDDDEVYFEGISTDCDSEEAFAPLTGIGYEYGCTTIWYKNAGGVWEML